MLASVVPPSALTPSQSSALAAVDPERMARLVRSIYREFKNNPLARAGFEELFSRVEFSDLPLSAWIDQIVTVYEWLERSGSTALFSDVTAYVSCSIHGSSSQPGHNLSWYLEQYGFEKSIPR